MLILLVLSLIASSFGQSSDGEKQCDLKKWEAYESGDGGLYEFGFNNDKLSFSQAEATCGLCGAGLITVKSEEEYNFTQTVVMDLGKETASFWLGATDTEVEGEWRWLDGDRVNYTHWSSAEPDNVDGNSTNADCMIVSNRGVWRDWGCDNPKKSLCRRRDNKTEADVDIGVSTELPVTTVEIVVDTTEPPTTTTATPPTVTLPPPTTTTPPATITTLPPTTGTPPPTTTIPPTTTTTPLPTATTLPPTTTTPPPTTTTPPSTTTTPPPTTTTPPPTTTIPTTQPRTVATTRRPITTTKQPNSISSWWRRLGRVIRGKKR